MGKPGMRNSQSSHAEYIGMGGEPGEVKHLSTLRKRKQIRDSLSSGERTGKSPNRSEAIRSGLWGCFRVYPGSYKSVIAEGSGKASQRG